MWQVNGVFTVIRTVDTVDTINLRSPQNTQYVIGRFSGKVSNV